MRVLAIIQARTGSTRLPGKTMMNLAERPILEHIIDRVSRSHLVDETMVATTVNRDDFQIVELCKRKKIRVFCGSENDVLDRFYQAAKSINTENVVRITADCPLIDHKIINKIIAKHLYAEADYTSNVLEESYPDGEDVEIFKFSVLEDAVKNALLSSEREHVTLYMRNNPEKYKLISVKNNVDLSSKRWTVDNKEDYEFIQKIYDAHHAKDHFFGMDQILKFLIANPEIEKINQHIERNQGLKKSLEEDKVIER